VPLFSLAFATHLFVARAPAALRILPFQMCRPFPTPIQEHNSLGFYRRAIAHPEGDVDSAKPGATRNTIIDVRGCLPRSGRQPAISQLR
jgi:hypothetical protein